MADCSYDSGMASHPSSSSLLFSANTPTPAPPPQSPDHRISTSAQPMRSNSAKRDRRLSRNARPPNSADGSDAPPPLPLFARGRGETRTAEGSGQHSSLLPGKPTSPSQPPSAWPSTDSRKRVSSSSSRQQREWPSAFPLPLFVEQEAGDQTLPSPSSSPQPNSHLRVSSQINRAHSMREAGDTDNGRKGGGGPSIDRQTWRLPSHYVDSTSPSKRSDRRIVSPSASMSILAGNGPRDEGEYSNEKRSLWTRNARRWSSSLPRGRDSALFAFRLAENASPYLRAGLEELRSIFDVDSNPIPNSPFVDDDEEDALQNTSHSDGEEGSTPLSRQPSSMLSTEGTNRTLTSSPAAISSREVSPSRSSIALLRTPSNEKKDAVQRRNGDFVASFFSTPAFMHHQRGESNLSEPRMIPHVNHRLLAWSLSVIAVGMTVLCAWGYALQSDTFSITLIGFFLTQPAFALAALTSLLMRKRAWMDLFSRAIRAHVLAQALIVILAYLDLSASSLYVREPAEADLSADGAYGSRIGFKDRFRMVPTMEMRFGPLRGAMVAGDAPDVFAASPSSILSSYAPHDLDLPYSPSAGSGSVHAHDSLVGDWRSRLTHLIVFVVQAAAPIVMILVGQYIVAQRLAWLARQGSLSRQSSLRQQQQQQQQQELKTSSDETPPPAYVPGAGLHRPLARLQIPSAKRQERRTMPPMMRLPGESSTGNGGTMPRYRREDQRRRRLATTSGLHEYEAHAHAQEGNDVVLPSFSIESAPHEHPLRVHRHQRSTSQPVNFLTDGATQVASGSPCTAATGLGMMFEEVQPRGDHTTTPGPDTSSSANSSSGAPVAVA